MPTFEIVRFINVALLIVVAFIILTNYKHLHIARLKVFAFIVLLNAIAGFISIVTSKLNVNNTPIGCIYSVAQLFLIVTYSTEPTLQRRLRVPLFIGAAIISGIFAYYFFFVNYRKFPGNAAALMALFVCAISLHQLIVWFRKGPGQPWELLIIFSLFSFYFMTMLSFYYSDIMPAQNANFPWYLVDIVNIATSLLILIAYLHYLNGKRV